MDADARAALKAQLKIDEGFQSEPYTDTTGNQTIGYGHRILANEHFHTPMGGDDADALLDADVDKHVNDLQIHLPWFVNLSDLCQQELANMAFNLGVPTLLKFDIFLGLLRDGHYAAAAIDLTKSLWFRQVGARGRRIETAIASEGISNDGQNDSSNA